MKTKITSFFTLLGLFIAPFAWSQSYIGHAVDNYSGIHGLTINPSSVVDSHLRADINLFSVSAFVGSDYFGLKPKVLIESEDGFSFEGGFDRHPSDSNNFFLNMDILGPSFMFNLTKKSSIGVTSRMRAIFNLNNINGTLFENLEDGFDETGNYSFAMDNFSGTLHVWGEVGLTYGRILLQGGQHFLKGGLTLKYLEGGGSTYFYSPSVTGEYVADTGMITTSGELVYGGTPGFDSDDVSYESSGSGFGGDIGFTYEYRPRLLEEGETAGHSDYKLKIGVSVTDIGNISYAESTVTNHDLNNTVHKDRFEGDFQTVLEEEYPGTEEIVESEIGLPTAAHVLVDYNLRKRLYVSVHGTMSLIPEDAEQVNRVINSVTATPRLETRWFSFYLPIGLRQYDGLAMGAGLRLGPLTVGSGSIISNYISDSSKTTDVYAGLKIPIYR